MTEKRILGIMGNTGSGKGRLADYLVRHHQYVEIALADPIKRTAMDWYGFTREQLWGPSHLRNEPDPRYPTGRGFLAPRTACRNLGDNGGRASYEDTFVNLAVVAARMVLEGKADYIPELGLIPRHFLRSLIFSKPAGVVISDIRRTNELRKIRGLGGVILRLRRAGKDGHIEGLPCHPSETDQHSIPDSEVDYVLQVPDGEDGEIDFPEYYRRADCFLEWLETYDLSRRVLVTQAQEPVQETLDHE